MLEQLVADMTCRQLMLVGTYVVWLMVGQRCSGFECSRVQKYYSMGVWSSKCENSVHPNDLFYESALGLPQNFNKRQDVGCLVCACIPLRQMTVLCCKLQRDATDFTCFLHGKRSRTRFWRTDIKSSIKLASRGNVVRWTELTTALSRDPKPVKVHLIVISGPRADCHQ